MGQTFAKRSISTEAAHRIIAAAEAKAAEVGTPMVIAVVDDGGVLKAFSRMDGAALLSVQVAQDKAYTAVGFGMPTHGWHDFIKDDPPLRDGAPTGIERLVVFGGGYPITVDEQIVGAIGVSGGHYSEDQKVADALTAPSPLRLRRAEAGTRTRTVALGVAAATMVMAASAFAIGMTSEHLR